MINKTGKVIIENDHVTITEFHFEGVDRHIAELEALIWAQGELACALAKTLSNFENTGILAII